jgi:guanylate kinase
VSTVEPRGVLLVLAGTSGAGKGTLGRRLLEQDPGLQWSVSWTTRPPRPDEKPGVDYHFVSREEFERLRDAGGFLEWFEVYGDLKGTPRAFVEQALAAGHDVLLELDVHGSLAVRAAIADALLVFVRAPSREEQQRRLVARAADDPEAMVRRLARAEAEERIGEAQFDAVIVNDDVGRATSELAAIVEARRSGAQ